MDSAHASCGISLRKQSTRQTEAQSTFAREEVYCTECVDAVERALRAQPHITAVHVDWDANVAYVRYHPDSISQDTMERIIAGTGCAGASDHGAEESVRPCRPRAALARTTPGLALCPRAAMHLLPTRTDP